MGKLLLRAPLPRRDDDVAFDALRPLRLVRGQLALGHAIGPIAEILERHAAELSGNAVHHELAGLSGGDARVHASAPVLNSPNWAGMVRVASCPS